jgi:hypothetical protein
LPYVDLYKGLTNNTKAQKKIYISGTNAVFFSKFIYNNFVLQKMVRL